MTRVLGWLLLVVVGVALGISLLPIIEAMRPEETEPSPAVSLTGAVERRTLREELVVRAGVDRPPGGDIKSAGAGTVTNVSVAPGRLVEPGDIVLEIDDAPVVAMAGTRPFWRRLGEGDTGPDVARLQGLLVGEGLLDEVDGRFGATTGSAVKAWMTAIGHPGPTTVFDPGLVAVAPWPLRVSSVAVVPGDLVSPGMPLLSTAIDRLEVTLVLSPNEYGQVNEGDAVDLDLGNGTVLPGVIKTIDDTPFLGEAGEIRYQASVRFSGPLDVPVGGQIPASVVTAESANTLAVPLAAIVADASGGPAVRVAQDDGTSVVRSVELGISDPPWVEVLSGVVEGELVELATR